MPEFNKIIHRTIKLALFWVGLAVMFLNNNFHLEQIKMYLSIGTDILLYSFIFSCIIYILPITCKLLFKNNKLISEQTPCKIIPFSESNRCIILDGEWGTGKTHYYDYTLKPEITKFYSSPVEISCFSATKNEFVSRLIVSNPIYNFISLNGIFSNLMINNWTSFMPTNKVIVFDDFERLGLTSGDKDKTYADILGIIDYLKKNNFILLIVNINKSDSQILNDYFEKIVETIIYPIVSDYNKIFTLQKDKLFKSAENEIIDKVNAEKIFNVIVKSIEQIRISQKEKNIRMLINSQYYLFHAFKSFKLLEDTSNLGETILTNFITTFLETRIKIHMLFFKNHKLYNTAIETLQTKQEDSPEYKEIETKLKPYDLTISTFFKESIVNIPPITESLINIDLERRLVYFALKLFIRNQEEISGAEYLNYVSKSQFINFIDDNYQQMRDKPASLDADLFMWHTILKDNNNSASIKTLDFISNDKSLNLILKYAKYVKDGYLKYWQNKQHFEKNSDEYNTEAEFAIELALNEYIDLMQQKMKENIFKFVKILLENQQFEYIHQNKLMHQYNCYLENEIKNHNQFISEFNQDYNTEYDIDQNYNLLANNLTYFFQYVLYCKKEIDMNNKQINTIFKFIHDKQGYRFSPGFFTTTSDTEDDFLKILLDNFDYYEQSIIKGYIKNSNQVPLINEEPHAT